MSTQPTGTVTVSVSSGDTEAATVSPASLSFTAADYSTSQTVTVTGVQDADASNESTTVSLSSSGGDYASVSSSVSVTVTDDDSETPSVPAGTPSFGASTILSQTWVKDTAISSLTLPAATGGKGDLTYSLAGTLPAGVTFDVSTRTLSGTPTAKQEAVEHTYTATDTDGAVASLSFTIRVAGQASDNAAFVSYADVPSRIAAGSSATVTVRMASPLATEAPWPTTTRIQGGQVGIHEVSGWTADSSDAAIARPPSGLDAGSWSMLLRGSDGGGDGAPDVALTEDWIPVEGGTYQLSACMLRENAGDNVLVDFDDGKGRDADFADAHLVATSTGSWECRAVTKCIPGSVGAVRIRAVRDGANLGGAWFDRTELKRIAACTEEPGLSRP